MRRYPPFDGDGEVMPLRLPTPPRGTFWVLGAIGIVILLLAVGGPLISFAAELLWFKALGLQAVYTTRLGYQFGLFFASLLLAFVYVAANVLIALRLRTSSVLRTIGIRRRFLRSAAGVIGLIAAAVIAFLVSAGAATFWQQLMLFLNGRPTGTTEPVFGMDISFYLFTLPFLKSALGWALALSFLTVLLVAALYAWRDTDFELRLPNRGIAHVSVLFAVVALVVAAGAFVGRYDLLYSHNGYVWGAGYTDVNARIPIAYISTGLGVLLAIALLANAALRRLWLPVVALAVWIVFGILSAVYAQAIESLVVSPQQYTREEQYIRRELSYTRQAFGLDKVTVNQYSGTASLTSQDISQDQTTIDNLRLWDVRQLQETYPQLQAIRTYYTLDNIDLDRYTINGVYEQLELAARELDVTKLPSQSQTFVNTSLTYTHGYSVVASPVRSVVGEGLPDLIAQNIPPTGDLMVTQPDIYFGESTPNYVLAPSDQKEFDYPSGSGDVYANYKGTHGVPLTGVNRLLWAAYTQDLNLLITTQVNSKTQILYRRNIIDRVNAIAPFLTFDSDPYIVVVNGKLYWIIDAYTTADTYPYSQLDSGSQVNYIRNSVKVVIDAYEGTADFYIADPNDPIIKAYAKAFPTLFKPIDAMPAGLRQHIRYPEDLFNIQVSVYRTYHMTDPQVFYNREDVWATPDESTGPGASAPLQPYYVLMRLPNQTKAEYLLIQPFTPNNRQNMISWLAARNDAPNYGQLVLYQLPKDTNIYGPAQIGNRIQENTAISSQFTLWNQSGSQVQQGNLLVVPVGGTFLYFEPVYLRATSSSSLPEFKKVILADTQNVVWDDTLEGALAQLVGAAPIQTTPSPAVTAGTPTCAQLIAQAEQDYSAAQSRLAAQDLAGYAADVQKVGDLLTQMQTAGCAAGASPSPSASASPSPSPSPSR
ncbi:MAG TPA: UPF0182 family protein [Candidatus Dormibacteraeota bacterium]|nr:UPF0182 family protein [Candidatus Dormibacteraeota bacterium]